MTEKGDHDWKIFLTGFVIGMTCCMSVFGYIWYSRGLP